jgi:hypothetical protein
MAKATCQQLGSSGCLAVQYKDVLQYNLLLPTCVAALVGGSSFLAKFSSSLVAPGAWLNLAAVWWLQFLG